MSQKSGSKLNLTNVHQQSQHHNRQKSNSEIVLNIDSINDGTSKHMRQPSNHQVPKLHRTVHTEMVQSASSSSLRQLGSQSSEPSSETQQQQQLLYFVDPRVSNNFISIFSNLKRKLNNKGFQF
jgi:hypothetical protein